MRRLLAATIITLWPFGSFADRNVDDCERALESFAAFSGDLFQRNNTGLARSDDGLCYFGRGSGQVAFRSGTFRVDETAGTNGPRRSIDFALAQAETPLGVLDLIGKITQDLGSGALRLERLTAARDDAPVILAQAELMLLPAGSTPRLSDLAAESIRVRINVTPELLQDLGWNYGEVTRVALERVLKDVNRTQISNAARGAFLRLAQAAPAAQGRLEVELAFGENVNIAQIMGLVAASKDDDLAPALARAFPGATLMLIWNPGRL